MDRVAGNKIPGLTGFKWMIFQGVKKQIGSVRGRIETGVARRPGFSKQSSSTAQRAPGSIPKMVAKSWTTVLFISANAAINPTVKEKMEAILKAHRSRLVCDKAPDNAFYRAGPSLTTKPQLIGLASPSYA